MVKHNRKLTAAIVLIATIILCVNILPSIKVSADKKKSRVIVSMGDSYSSGEGVPPFGDNYEEYMEFDQLRGTDYDSRSIEEKVKDENWLAHRSIWAWSGLLALPDVGVVNLTKHDEDPKWYFVASSGAETKHIHSEQEKPYSKGKFKSDKKSPPTLAPQIEVFDQLDDGVTADYVTLTIGGNDAGFTSIVTTAALTGYYYAPCLLTDEFAAVWIDYFRPGGIKDDLHEVYDTISKRAGKDTCILVGGYPQLFDPLGGDYYGIKLFNVKEAIEIDANVSLFNKAIKNLVDKCKKEGMNIEFVSVEEAFYGHGAYSDDPFINPVIFGSQSEDLKDKSPTSAYSIHPNQKGICAYRDCFQHAINKKEGLPDDWIEEYIATPTPTPSPTPAIDMDVLKAAYRDVLHDYEFEMRMIETDRHGAMNSCALTDLTGDGFPELLILYCSEKEMKKDVHDFIDGYRFADIRIYTMTPEDTEAKDMLHISNIAGIGGAGYYSDLLLLSNGNLLIRTSIGDEFGSYYFDEYVLDEYEFINLNNLSVSGNPYYDGDTWISNNNYYINGVEISESEFDSLVDNYMDRFSIVLAMNPWYSSPSSDWEQAVLDTPSEILNFDEAWELLRSSKESALDLSEETVCLGVTNYMYDEEHIGGVVDGPGTWVDDGYWIENGLYITGAGFQTGATARYITYPSTGLTYETICLPPYGHFNPDDYYKTGVYFYVQDYIY